MATSLGPIGIRAIEGRHLSVETAVRFGLYTAKKAGANVVPDDTGNIVVFPYIERGVIVNEKYRAPEKRFWQRTGGRKTFWNSDALDDPALAAGQMPLVITEGELDALTAIDCGFPLSVSVPDGAPPPKANSNDADKQADVEDDKTGKFEFLWNNRDRLRRVKRFVLAVDSDAPGQRLAEELVRRLSAARCYFVNYPAGCKDLNDVLMRHGSEKVSLLLNEAKPYPVRGLYHLSDYPDLGPLPTYTTGWPTMDNHLLMFAGEFMMVTGIPSHGKSTWALNLLSRMADLHGWRSAIFSPEMATVPHLRDKLRSIRGGSQADRWIENNFVFIDADPTGQEDDDFNLEWVLERAEDAVLRDDVRILLIDPWNEVEHARRQGESMTDYIGRSIRSIKRFARLRSVAVIVVAHPTKDVWKEGKPRTPTLYDIEGSAHWFNKCDHGVIIERPDPAEDVTNVWIAKSRFEQAGERGMIKLRFERSSSRYHLLDEGI